MSTVGRADSAIATAYIAEYAPRGRRGALSILQRLGWIMVCFAAIAVIAIAFVYRYLPETKNHSVEEVTNLYERTTAGEPASKLASQDADAAQA